MITGKKDAEVIRTVINKLIRGPSLSFTGFVPLVGLPTRIQLEVTDNAEEQVKCWAKTWLISELNNLLPDSEKVKL